MIPNRFSKPEKPGPDVDAEPVEEEKVRVKEENVENVGTKAQ